MSWRSALLACTGAAMHQACELEFCSFANWAKIQKMLAVWEPDHHFDRASRAAHENPKFGGAASHPARWAVRRRGVTPLQLT